MEDATGRLKLHKCKGPMRFGGGGGGRALSNLVPKYYGQGSETCTCDSGGDYKLSLAGRHKKFFKKSKCGGLGVVGGTAEPSAQKDAPLLHRQGHSQSLHQPPTPAWAASSRQDVKLANGMGHAGKISEGLFWGTGMGWTTCTQTGW